MLDACVLTGIQSAQSRQPNGRSEHSEFRDRIRRCFIHGRIRVPRPRTSRVAAQLEHSDRRKWRISRVKGFRRSLERRQNRHRHRGRDRRTYSPRSVGDLFIVRRHRASQKTRHHPRGGLARPEYPMSEFTPSQKDLTSNAAPPGLNRF